jgi:hypothetical protein
LGDPYYQGDIGAGLYGDAEYGDPDPLAAFVQMSGDIDDGDAETGGPVGGFIKKYRKPLMIAGGAAAGFGLGKLAQQAIAKNRARASQRANIAHSLAMTKASQSINRQSNISSSIGKLNRNAPMRFFSLAGAKMNSSPIDPQSVFVMDMFKNELDRQQMDTPFLQESAVGVFAAGTWTATATGTVASRFFTGLILQFGTNALNAVPSSVISITATIPLINGGVLTIAAQPFLFTYEKGFDVHFLFFPWTLVANKPLLTLGQYNNANPITFTLTGLPAASAVTLIVPGSQHPWAVGMRNALIK